MADGVSVDARELAVLSTDLTKIAASAVPMASNAVRRTALDLVAGAKVRAPVDTGFLKNSISATIDPSGLDAEVGPTANYGVFVELGTSRKAPRPYLGPALEEVRPGFEQALAQLADGIAS
jgi:HK97 gp10 family phage protein